MNKLCAAGNHNYVRHTNGKGKTYFYLNIEAMDGSGSYMDKCAACGHCRFVDAPPRVPKPAAKPEVQP